MFKFWWPIGLIILSSVGYQVGLKEVSTGMDPFVALVVTYLVASAVSFAIYFIQLHTCILICSPLICPELL